MTERSRQMIRTGSVVLAGMVALGAAACAEEQPRAGEEVVQAGAMQARTAEQEREEFRSLRDRTQDQASQDRVSPDVAESLHHARALSRAFQHAAQTIDPAVVHIIQQREVRVRHLLGPTERRLAPAGTGSGFIISPEGYIVTNHHVIAGATGVIVRLNDGREYQGEVVGSDPATDLGLVKIEGDDLAVARFGNSEALEVGEWVLAVGSPFGIFNNTVTAGIVSAKGRRGLRGPQDRFEDFIQTDAAINPGNSGGPLVNLEGEVVGINSQIATRTGGSVGIGFAIPSAIAEFVVDSLINTGRVERGWVGVQSTDVERIGPELQAMYERAGAEPGQGTLILGVVPDGPADRAGLQEGDVVLSVNGRPTPDFGRFRNTVAFTTPGSRATLDIMRDGERQQLEVRISDTTRGRALLPGGAAYPAFGFTVSTLPPEAGRRLARYTGVSEGVVVEEVEELGPAAQLEPVRLQRGDVIVAVNRRGIARAEEFDEVVRSLGEGEPIRVSVFRPGTLQSGWLEIQPRP